MKNESCLRWDSNPRHTVLQTDALPTEQPKAAQLAGSESTCMQVVMYMYLHSCTYMYASSHVHVHVLNASCHVLKGMYMYMYMYLVGDCYFSKSGYMYM